MAKQKNRRVRLLCKGLEHFREALYTEPVVDASSKKDQCAPPASSVPEVTADKESYTKPVVDTTSNNKSAPSAVSPATEATADKESIVSADTTAETNRSSVKKPCTFYTADGVELFKTLIPAKKTPPTSPGSDASSSTAVDPSSRKVSPCGSDTKDFAYSSSDEHHVLDPTTIIEETTKKQLLKQLKKTAAIEDKTSRKVVKLAAENKALNAELTSANATVRNRDAQTDLAKTYANAMILSNIVLRQAVLDIGHQVRSEQNGNPKGEALPEHLRIMDAVSVSAHRGMARLEDRSAGQGQDVDVQNRRDTTEENHPESREESMFSNAPKLQPPNTVANLEDAKSADRTVLNDYRQQRIKSEGYPAEEIMEQGERNLGMIPANLHRKESAVREGEILHTTAATSEDSVPENLEWSKSSGKNPALGAIKDSSTPSEVENLAPESHGDDAVTQEPIEDALIPQKHVQGTNNSATYEFPEPAGPATLWGILQSNQIVGGMSPECDDVDGANSTSKGDTSTKHEFPEPAGPATLWGVLQSNQTSGEFDTEGNQDESSTTQEPVSGVYDQDMDCGRGEVVSATYEFSEPAGPATLWGILQSNQTVGEKGPEGDHDDHNEVEGTNGDTNTIHEFLEPAGPATMWGILQSEQTTKDIGSEGDHTQGDHTEDAATQDLVAVENELVGHVKAVDNGCEVVRSQIYEFSEPSGAATLWGILQSSQTEETAPEGDHTKVTAPQEPITDDNKLVDHAKPMDNGCEGGVNQEYEFSEPSGAATLCGTLQSNQDESSEPTDPTTLCGQLQSSLSEEVKDNSALTAGEPDLASDSNESPTNQEPGNQEPETREPEVEEPTAAPVQEEDYTQSKADAGEEAAPEAGDQAPQAKDLYFDLSEIDVSGAQGNLEPQGVSKIETSTSQEAFSTLIGNTQGDFGNDENLAEQGTEIAIMLDIQSESGQSTIVQGQGDSGLIDLSLNDSSVPLDKDCGIPKFKFPEEEISAPTTADTSGINYTRYRDEIEEDLFLQNSAHADISTQSARTSSLPEPEVFDFPCIIPKPRSQAEIKAERKKAEHKRYKAKKKAEATAKLRLKDEEKKEVAEDVEPLTPKTLVESQAVPCADPKPSSKSGAEIKAEKNAERKRYKGKKYAQAAAKRRLKEEVAEVEPLEPPQTLAQLQAKEDAMLGDRRLQQQAQRQEQQDRAASLRGVVRASRAHLIY